MVRLVLLDHDKVILSSGKILFVSACYQIDEDIIFVNKTTNLSFIFYATFHELYHHLIYYFAIGTIITKLNTWVDRIDYFIWLKENLAIGRTNFLKEKQKELFKK